MTCRMRGVPCAGVITLRIPVQLFLQLILFFISITSAHAFTLFGDDTPKPVPDWFNSVPVGAKGYEYYGTGRGSDEKEARGNALEAIASAIRSDIDSGFFNKVEVRNGSISQEKRSILKVKSDMSLTDVEIVKKAQIDNVSYVLMKYENLTIGKKCRKWLPSAECAGEKQNSYLTKTPLFQEINAEAGCAPSLRVVRQNKLWCLTLNGSDKIIPLTEFDFEKLLVPHLSPKISLIPSKELLVEGSTLSFTVTAQEDGFVTLLDVVENGEVFIISANQPVKGHRPVVLPDPSGEKELVAGLLPGRNKATDLYVAVFNDSRIDFSRLQTAGDKVALDEEHFKFAELLSFLDTYEFSSVIVRTSAGTAGLK